MRIGVNITRVDKRKQGRAGEDKTEVAREISGNRYNRHEKIEFRGGGKSQRKAGGREEGKRGV